MIRKKIDFKQVEAFLIENPDFFLQKPSILEKINFPLSSRDDKKNDEKIISFKDWLIENLKNKQKSLIDNAKHNFFTQKKVHSAILQLLKKETLKSLILFLNERLSKHFDLEIISLVTSNVDFSKKNKSIFLEPEKINVLYNSHNYLIMDAVDEIVGIFRGVNQKIYSNAIFSLDVNIIKSNSAQNLIEDSKIGDAELNLNKMTIKLNNKTKKINSAEKNVLLKMLSSPGKIFSRKEIGTISKISQERSIDVMITRLRKKIELNPKNPKFLQTIRGSGYVLWIK